MRIISRIKRVKRVFLRLENSQDVSISEYFSNLNREIDSIKRDICTIGALSITIRPSNPELDYEFLRLSDDSKLIKGGVACGPSA
jgi:hypothetical protein